jgi:hypothetical protein
MPEDDDGKLPDGDEDEIYDDPDEWCDCCDDPSWEDDD